MSISNHGELQVLDEIFNAGGGTFPSANVYISLHTADPGETGANEVAGGSYARQQADFTAASGGTLSNSANIEFTGMPSTTVMAWGAWDAVSAGNCFWTGFLTVTSGLAVVRSGDLAGNDVQSVAHGLVADDRVAFEAFEALTAPAGLTLGQVYFVLAAGLTTDAFNVSDSSGGAEEDITAAGSAVWRKVTPQPVNAGNIFRIATGELDIFLD